MNVSVGDKVIYSKYAGTEVELDDEEYIIVKQNDILAIVIEDNIRKSDLDGYFRSDSNGKGN